MHSPVDDDWIGVPIFGAREEGRPWVIRPSAYGLVEDPEGRVAIVRSVDGVFLPGGGIEPGETAEEALRREALEECGFAVRLGPWTMRAIQFAYSASENSWFEKRSAFIECSVEGLDRSLALPGHELLWVATDRAATMLSHKSHGWAIRAWKARSARP